MVYPWYELISLSDDILQGDFVEDCPIIIPPKSLEEDQEITIKLLNAIVLSQSCDLENGKIEIVLVCPYSNLEEFLSSHPNSKDGSKKGREKVIENLLQGNYPSYHFLQKDENCNLHDFIIVDFKNVYGVHYDYLKSHILKIKKRTRLLPPYREHLSQAFARYFMRVGLPINIKI